MKRKRFLSELHCFVVNHIYIVSLSEEIHDAKARVPSTSQKSFPKQCLHHQKTTHHHKSHNSTPFCQYRPCILHFLRCILQRSHKRRIPRLHSTTHSNHGRPVDRESTMRLCSRQIHGMTILLGAGTTARKGCSSSARCKRCCHVLGKYWNKGKRTCFCGENWLSS